jgi:hypothetical protein
MTTAAFEDSAPGGQHRCLRCGHWNTTEITACRVCLAPISGSGLRLKAPLVGRGVVTGGSLFACAGLLLGLSAVPGSPIRALRQRLFPETRHRVIAVPVTLPQGYQKFEPPAGCFIGAYVLQDINISGNMQRWVDLTQKGHASYLRYLGYGRPFPKDWVAAVRKMGAVPNLALEPNAGLAQVQDCKPTCKHKLTTRHGKKGLEEVSCLRRLARDAAESGGPVFMRFASEMNGPWTAYHGDPAAYREKFRMVAELMREEAPNVAMVWTPYCTPLGPIPDYYPGDDVVDWVGVNIYSVHHHDGDRNHPAHREDPAELLKPIYDLYADRKPIQISEYAATHTCKACDSYTADFAMDKMIRMYRSLPTRFPRVKMIYWFSYDTISGKAAENNYAVTDDPVIRDTYRRLIAPDYFIPSIPEGAYWVQKKAPHPDPPAAP